MVLLTIALVFVVLPHYGIRTLPGRVEYLAPPEPEKVEYIAIPPSDLAKILFSTGVSERARETTWSDAQGKWVVWVGKVHRVEPQLRPSRIVFLDEYETPPLSLDSGQFDIIVEFDPAWTERLKQLTTGELVYYRAKLVKYDWGWGLNLLTLEQGEIVPHDDVAAKLVDLAYTSYRQLGELVEEAENIAAVSRFFEDKLRDGEKKIAIETMLGLVGLDISDKYWLLEETPLLELRARKNSLKFSIEHHLQEALGALHHSDPPNDAVLRQKIEETLRSNNIVVEGTKTVSKVLKDFWEEEKRSAEPDISDATLALLLKKLPPLSAAKTVMEGIIEYGKLDAYETIVGTCHMELGTIESSMERIHDNVVEVINEVIRTARQGA
jgi:hypothetical protein